MVRLSKKNQKELNSLINSLLVWESLAKDALNRKETATAKEYHSHFNFYADRLNGLFGTNVVKFGE